MRSEHDVERGAATTIVVDGRQISAFDGETIAAAMLAADALAFRLDTRGRPRGMFCNMGSCSECLVDVVDVDGVRRRLRACMTTVSAGLSVSTGTSA